jgi:tetratricopeptide (TPR) repeat protein
MRRRGQPIPAIRMIWRRFREWRERRSAISELRAISADREARLLDNHDNPLRRAAVLAGLGQHEEAAELWAQARSQMPNAILESEAPLEILCDLRRFDEAEALMRERLLRFPADRFPLEGLAKIAEARGDLDLAVDRWASVRDKSPERAHGYYGRARCLFALGRHDEAEQEADAAIRKGPEQLDGWVIRGLVSDHRGDWEESIVRWKKLTETHRFTPGHARAANAMMELGRLDEAEAYLMEPGQRFGGDLEIALTRARLAGRRGDNGAARERWAVVRRGHPDFQAGYSEGLPCLLALGSHDEAELVLREAAERFPLEMWPVREAARLSHQRGDLLEAARRWVILQKRFPGTNADFIPDDDHLRLVGDDPLTEPGEGNTKSSE